MYRTSRTDKSKHRPPTPSNAASNTVRQTRKRQAYPQDDSNITRSHQSVVRRIKVLRLTQKRLERDLRRNKNCTATYVKLGSILMELGDWDETVRVLQQATRLGLYEATILSSLGQGMFENEHDPSAVVHCLEAALQVQNMESARNTINIPIDSPSKKKKSSKGTESLLTLDHFAYLARAYAANEHPAESIRTLETHIFSLSTLNSLIKPNVSTTTGDVAYNGARRNSRLGRPSSAVRTKRKYSVPKTNLSRETMPPRSVRFGGIGAHHVLCASQLIEQGEFDQALGHYERAHALAVSLPPYTRADVWLLIGRVYDRIGRQDMAQASFINSGQNIELVTVWIALAQVHQVQHDIVGATDALEQAVLRDPVGRMQRHALDRIRQSQKRRQDARTVQRTGNESRIPELTRSSNHAGLRRGLCLTNSRLKLIQISLNAERARNRNLMAAQATALAQAEARGSVGLAVDFTKSLKLCWSSITALAEQEKRCVALKLCIEERIDLRQRAYETDLQRNQDDESTSISIPSSCSSVSSCGEEDKQRMHGYKQQKPCLTSFQVEELRIETNITLCALECELAFRACNYAFAATLDKLEDALFVQTVRDSWSSALDISNITFSEASLRDDISPRTDSDSNSLPSPSHKELTENIHGDDIAYIKTERVLGAALADWKRRWAKLHQSQVVTRCDSSATSRQSSSFIISLEAPSGLVDITRDALVGVYANAGVRTCGLVEESSSGRALPRFRKVQFERQLNEFAQSVNDSLPTSALKKGIQVDKELESNKVGNEQKLGKDDDLEEDEIASPWGRLEAEEDNRVQKNKSIPGVATVVDTEVSESSDNEEHESDPGFLVQNKRIHTTFATAKNLLRMFGSNLAANDVNEDDAIEEEEEKEKEEKNMHAYSNYVGGDSDSDHGTLGDEADSVYSHHSREDGDQLVGVSQAMSKTRRASSESRWLQEGTIHEEVEEHENENESSADSLYAGDAADDTGTDADVVDDDAGDESSLDSVDSEISVDQSGGERSVSSVDTQKGENALNSVLAGVGGNKSSASTHQAAIIHENDLKRKLVGEGKTEGTTAVLLSTADSATEPRTEKAAHIIENMAQDGDKSAETTVRGSVMRKPMSPSFMTVGTDNPSVSSRSPRRSLLIGWGSELESSKSELTTAALTTTAATSANPRRTMSMGSKPLGPKIDINNVKEHKDHIIRSSMEMLADIDNEDDDDDIFLASNDNTAFQWPDNFK